MELFIQCLDNLEDLYFATALKMERVRRALYVAVILLSSFLLPFCGVLLALSRPPLALAAVCLMIVGMLYRGATGGQPGRRFAA